MSIAAIVTLGYGSFGSPSLIIELGYTPGAAPAAAKDTHDYPLVSESDLRKHKARLKRNANALEAREQEKIEQLQKLRNQLRGIEDETPAEIAENIVDKLEAQGLQAPPPIDRAQLEAAIEKLVAEIMEVTENKRRELQKIQDEEDIKVLLMLL